MTPQLEGTITQPIKAYHQFTIIPCMVPWAIEHGLIPAPKRDEDYPEDTDEKPYDPDAP